MDKSPIEHASIALTRWIGSMASLVAHTLFFLACFALAVFGVLAFDEMFLILTTVVSLEAIYLAIFIQMTVNRQAAELAEVSEDVGEIQEDIGEIQEDVEDIQEDIDEVQKDVDELQEDVEDISEDVEEMSEEDEKKLANHTMRTEILAAIHADLKRLMTDVEKLKEE